MFLVPNGLVQSGHGLAGFWTRTKPKVDWTKKWWRFGSNRFSYSNLNIYIGELMRGTFFFLFVFCCERGVAEQRRQTSARPDERLSLADRPAYVEQNRGLMAVSGPARG